jgi:hypothetical protein
MSSNMRLDEHRGRVRIQSGTIKDGSTGQAPLSQSGRICIRGQGVEVRDEVKAVNLILLNDELPDRTKVISYRQRS